MLEWVAPATATISGCNPQVGPKPCWADCCLTPSQTGPGLPIPPRTQDWHLQHGGEPSQQAESRLLRPQKHVFRIPCCSGERTEGSGGGRRYHNPPHLAHLIGGHRWGWSSPHSSRAQPHALPLPAPAEACGDQSPAFTLATATGGTDGRLSWALHLHTRHCHTLAPR